VTIPGRRATTCAGYLAAMDSASLPYPFLPTVLLLFFKNFAPLKIFSTRPRVPIVASGS